MLVQAATAIAIAILLLLCHLVLSCVVLPMCPCGTSPRPAAPARKRLPSACCWPRAGCLHGCCRPLPAGRSQAPPSAPAESSAAAAHRQAHTAAVQGSSTVMQTECWGGSAKAWTRSNTLRGGPTVQRAALMKAFWTSSTAAGWQHSAGPPQAGNPTRMHNQQQASTHATPHHSQPVAAGGRPCTCSDPWSSWPHRRRYSWPVAGSVAYSSPRSTCTPQHSAAQHTQRGASCEAAY